jgi:hypothetical protein
MSITMVEERPIALRPWEVRAILDGRKTTFRRVVKLTDPSSTYACHDDDGWPMTADEYGDWSRDPCPFGGVGSRLWCRETWALVRFFKDWETGYVDDWKDWEGPVPNQAPPGWTVIYRTDGHWEEHKDDRGFRWRSPIPMPRWASRITLEVTGVKVERLQEITHPDIAAEGLIEDWDPEFSRTPYRYGRDQERFAQRWDADHAKEGHGWDLNRWVWVISFRRVEAK